MGGTACYLYCSIARSASSTWLWVGLLRREVADNRVTTQQLAEGDQSMPEWSTNWLWVGLLLKACQNGQLIGCGWIVCLCASHDLIEGVEWSLENGASSQG